MTLKLSECFKTSFQRDFNSINEVNETKEPNKRVEDKENISFYRNEDKFNELMEASTYLQDFKSKSVIPSEQMFIKMVNLSASFVVRDIRQGINWEQMGVAYNALLHLISLDRVETHLRASVSDQLISWLFQNFNSADQREKDKVKVILHRLYCKMPVKRPMMRRKISDLLLQHIYEERVSGVVEVLQLYSCVASGLGVPIREEHLIFLEKVLFPLHGVDELKKISKFLTYCIAQFLYKDGTLAQKVFSGVLRNWPKGNSENEIIFLQEVEDLLIVVEPFQFKKIHEDLLKQLSKCIISPLLQVCERCLKLFENARVLSLCLQNPRTVLPLLLPALLSASRTASPGRVLHLLACLEAADSCLFNFLVNAARQQPS